MRVVILIRSLGAGGAERQATVLAKGLASKGHIVSLVSFYNKGVFRENVKGTGVRYEAIGKTGRWHMATFLLGLRRILKRADPDVVYSSMPPANIAAVVSARLGARRHIVWRLASSDMSLSKYDWFSAASYKVEAAFSRFPAVIIANSYAGCEAAEKRGFPKAKLRVVVNGIETEVFVRAEEDGRSARREWGIDDGKRVIGIVARADPKKGYEDFLSAARMLRDVRNDVWFACIGAGEGRYAATLKSLAKAFGMDDAIVWRSCEQDMPRAYNALDINTVASRFGEGFPNSVGEAMSCGVPCVVTDVGDSALIVGATGELVPRQSPEDLMQGWQRLLYRLDNDEEDTRARARRRIVEKYSVSTYVDRTERVLREASA